MPFNQRTEIKLIKTQAKTKQKTHNLLLHIVDVMVDLGENAIDEIDGHLTHDQFICTRVGVRSSIH